MDIKPLKIVKTVEYINNLVDKYYRINHLQSAESWSREEKGLFIAQDGDVFIGCDNTSGDCFVEECSLETIIKMWLNDEISSDDVHKIQSEFKIRQKALLNRIRSEIRI